MFTPQVTFPFCPDQTEFLTFRSPDGFAAVYMELVEGFVTFTSDETPPQQLTRINLTNNSFYDSIEPAPALLARYAEIKRMRYAPPRQEPLNPTTVVKATVPAPAAQDRTAQAQGSVETPATSDTTASVPAQAQVPATSVFAPAPQPVRKIWQG